MAITLTGAMTAALGANISQPGLFLQLGFTTPLYYCDRAAGTSRAWNSLTWTEADFTVADYSIEIGVMQKLTLSFVDASFVLTALLLAQTSSDKVVKLWYFDSAATATLDPVLIFDGLIDNASGGDTRRVSVPCSTVDKMLPVGMLAHLIPPYLFAAEGTRIMWGPAGSTITFNRRQVYT